LLGLIKLEFVQGSFDDDVIYIIKKFVVILIFDGKKNGSSAFVQT